MRASPLAAGLLLLAASSSVAAHRYRASMSKGLTEHSATTDMDFFIPAGSCSGDITKDLFGENCKEVQYLRVELHDELLTNIIYINDALTEASIWRRANDDNKCPSEASILVKVSCNHYRRSDINFKFPRRHLNPSEKYKKNYLTQMIPCIE